MINWLETFGWNTENVKDLRFLAYLYLKQGKYDIAKDLFSGIIHLDPGNAYDLRTLGAIHLQLNENTDALVRLDQSLAIEPNHHLSLLNKAKVFIALNRKKEGLLIAKRLAKHQEVAVANKAQALLLAWG